MRTFLATALLIIVSSISDAQTINYTVDLTHTDTKEVIVTVKPNGFHSSHASYQMPVWAPGAYSVTNYGRFVKNFKALDRSGKEIPATKVNDSRWEMNGAENLASISYSVINSYKDTTSLYFAMCQIDTSFFFANGTALFGYLNDLKNIGSNIEYIVPNTWALNTALDQSKESNANDLPQYHYLSFQAAGYDELADAPVMGGEDILSRSFTQNGATYDIVLASDKPFPMDSLTEYTKKIVRTETDLFGDTPFKHYTFLINAPTFMKSPSQGFGALEHSNSSAYLLVNMDWDFFKQFGLSTISHEFFHLWNVKRIHSDKLGPFDYTKRVMTTSLWLSEGVTDYYANALLSRSGIMKPSYFEGKIAEWYAEATHSKAAKTETLEQLSIDESDFDIGKAVSFYTKGPLVAMMLDLEIRTRTDNKKSLDDVMRALYADAKKGKYFKDEELIGKIEKISGLDLMDFYHRYIAGTDSLPLVSYLPKMGLIKDYKEETKSGVSFQAHFVKDIANLVIDSFINAPKDIKIIKTSAGKDSTCEVTRHITTDLERAGLQAGDTIVSIDGKPIDFDSADEFSLNHAAPITINMVVARAGKHFETAVTLTNARSSRIEKRNVAPNKDATPAELAIRKAIYGG
ncbi:MAG TPA: hypothetical protein VEW28_09595 [Candidatus Kapabacteria bacterium]|nr:hypothetical protein [Candidatus Kapabacteria bacterium]